MFKCEQNPFADDYNKICFVLYKENYVPHGNYNVWKTFYDRQGVRFVRVKAAI